MWAWEVKLECKSTYPVTVERVIAVSTDDAIAIARHVARDDYEVTGVTKGLPFWLREPQVDF